MVQLILLSLLLRSVTANTFTPTCTQPTEITKIVSGPDVRSTWSILWSCLLTIFLCVWAVQHPLVPRPELKDNPKWKKVRDFILLNLISGMISLGAPELELGSSLGEAVQAHRWSKCEVMIRAAEKNGKRWTRAHAYLLVMQGFYCAKPDAEVDGTGETAQLLNEGHSDLEMTKPTISPDIETSTFQLEAQGSGKSCAFAHDDELNAQKENTWISTTHDISGYSIKPLELYYLVKHDLIADFPCITEDEIHDKSKEDAIMKLLPMGQIVWLIVQLIVRKVTGLASTQLEIATLSFGVCTFLTYAFYLHKPKDIKEPVRCHLRPLTDAQRTKFTRMQGHSDIDEKSIHGDTIALLPKLRVSLGTTGLLVGGVVFGAIHCAAWNFEFPSPLDQKLWRVASAVTIGLLPAYFALLAVLGESLSELWLVLVTVAYGVFRVMILVLTVRSLFHSPPGVFVATWTASFPHFGS